MSKLYCEIPVSARRTTPTARAHSVGGVRVKNWGFAIEATLHDCGGMDADLVHVVLRDLNTGREVIVCAGSIRAILDQNR